jgi:hypothetical protein
MVMYGTWSMVASVIWPIGFYVVMYQVSGLTNNTIVGDAELVCKCVGFYPQLGIHGLHVAQVRSLL